MPWQDPEHLRLLNKAAQRELQAGTSPDSVLNMLRENPVFQQLPSAQQSLEGLAAAASTPAKPSGLVQAHQQALEMRRQGAPHDQIRAFVQEQTGGQTDDWRVLRDMATGGNVAARADAAVQGRRTEPDEPGFLRRALDPRRRFEGIQPEGAEIPTQEEDGPLGRTLRRIPGVGDFLADQTHGEEGDQVIGPGVGSVFREGPVRGFPFVGEAAVQLTDAVGAVPGAAFRAATEEGTGFREAFGEEFRAQREEGDEFREENPGRSLGLNILGGVGGSLKILDKAGIPLSRALTGTGRRGSAETIRPDARRTRAIEDRLSQLPSREATKLREFGRGLREMPSFMRVPASRAAAVGGADAYLQTVGAAEDFDDLVNRIGDPIPLAVGGAFGAFSGGAFGTGRVFSELSRRTTALSKTATARVMHNLKNNFGTLDETLRSTQRQMREQSQREVRRQFFVPLENTAPLGNHPAVRRALEADDELRKSINAARAHRRRHLPDSPEEITWQDFQKARSEINDALVDATGVEKTALRRQFDNLNDALDQVPEIAELDAAAREAWLRATRPYDVVDAGLRVNPNSPLDEIRERGRDLYVIGGEVVPELEDMYRLSVFRRFLDDVGQGANVPELTANHRNTLRYALGFEPGAGGDQAIEIIERELRARNYDRMFDYAMKFGSFTFLGSSVLAGATNVWFGGSN